MEAITPSRHLVPYPDVTDPKTGKPLNVEALAQLHYRLSTALLAAAETFISDEMDLCLPLDGCWRSDALADSAERFANDCITAAVGEAEAHQRANARGLAFMAIQDAMRKDPDALPWEEVA